MKEEEGGDDEGEEFKIVIASASPPLALQGAKGASPSPPGIGASGRRKKISMKHVEVEMKDLSSRK